MIFGEETAELLALEAGAEFWDAEALTLDWECPCDDDYEVELQNKRVLFALEPELALKLGAAAERRGVSVVALVNDWLRQSLVEQGA